MEESNDLALITCSIHQGILTDPRTLQCLHAFCLKCIEGLFQACKSNKKPGEELEAPKCPLCRLCINVDIKDLPKSFDRNTLIENYNKKKLQSFEKAKQTIRQKRDRLNKGLEKFTSELVLSDQSRQRVKNEIDLAQEEVYTNTQLQIKILEDHQEAMTTRLNDIRTNYLTENDEEKSQYKETIQQIENLTNQCQHFENMNVEQFRTEDFDHLVDDYKTTVKESSSLYKKQVKRNSSVRYTPYPKTNGNNSVQDPQFGKIVHSVTDPSQCSIESLNQVRCGFLNQFNIMTRDAEGDVCYTSKALIRVQIQDIDGNDVRTELLNESQTGRYIVKYKAQKPSSYKVVVSIGGKPISNSPQNVETIDAKAEIEPVRVLFETTRTSVPLALAVHDNGEIAVVNNDHGKECRVVLFSADGEYFREFGGEGTGESRLSCPFGVAFTDDRLLVIDNQDDDGCIKEFDIHGNFKRTVHQEKGIRFERICTTEQSIACLTYNKDSKKTFIKLFSKETCDKTKDIKLDQVDSVATPMFFAYDNNKYFVSFVIIGSIYVFDMNGGLLNTFGEKGNKEGQFNIPFGLTVFGADMLLVCDSLNHRVHLWHQDGEFIRSFGSHGASLGQMKEPFDVVVAPNGQVFVLEVGGKRVQVFR